MGVLVLGDSEKLILERAGVQALILFGSRALGIARENSDFDLGVIGARSHEVYDLVYDLASAKIGKPVNIDLVFLKDAPQELRSHVASYGRVLYQNDPRVFADFREIVMQSSADFAPLRAIFSAATLARISL